ncbi:unnamed protein product, partial [Iphiclides podalirius]
MLWSKYPRYLTKVTLKTRQTVDRRRSGGAGGGVAAAGRAVHYLRAGAAARGTLQIHFRPPAAASKPVRESWPRRANESREWSGARRTDP